MAKDHISHPQSAEVVNWYFSAGHFWDLGSILIPLRGSVPTDILGCIQAPATTPDYETQGGTDCESEQ